MVPPVMSNSARYDATCCSPSGGGVSLCNLSYKRPSASHGLHADIEALTAKELNALSLEERERLFEELNGIASIVDEEPGFVTKCLHDLDQQIGRLRTGRSAYDLAMSMRPELLVDHDFRLMFLRCDCFDVPKAARRMINYFDTKLQLFGADKLVKKITYEDLDIDDIQALYTGSCHVLRSRDQAGRGIIFLTYKLMKSKSWVNQYRITWYQVMNALEDDRLQKKGFVVIGYAVGKHNMDQKFLDIMNNGRMLQESLPNRTVGVHFCYDLAALRPLSLLAQQLMVKDQRLRFQAHYGSDMECQYKLMRYGIPQGILTVNSSGKVKEAEFRRYVEQRRLLEEMRSRQSTDLIVKAANHTTEAEKVNAPNTNGEDAIVEITENDVILAKGGCRQKHPANARLSVLIEQHRSAYQSSLNKYEKSSISMSIVKAMKEGQGRFLKRRGRSGDMWYEINDKEARDAVSHRLRNEVPRRLIAEPKQGNRNGLNVADNVLSTGQDSRKRAKTRESLKQSL